MQQDITKRREDEPPDEPERVPRGKDSPQAQGVAGASDGPVAAHLIATEGGRLSCDLCRRYVSPGAPAVRKAWFVLSVCKRAFVDRVRVLRGLHLTEADAVLRVAPAHDGTAAQCPAGVQVRSEPLPRHDLLPQEAARRRSRSSRRANYCLALIRAIHEGGPQHGHASGVPVNGE